MIQRLRSIQLLCWPTTIEIAFPFRTPVRTIGFLVPFHTTAMTFDICVRIAALAPICPRYRRQIFQLYLLHFPLLGQTSRLSLGSLLHHFAL